MKRVIGLATAAFFLSRRGPSSIPAAAIRGEVGILRPRPMVPNRISGPPPHEELNRNFSDVPPPRCSAHSRRWPLG
jgi:hypothetical protein